MKYSDIQKLKKNKLINMIKFREIFPFDESYFDNEIEEKKVVRKVIKTEKCETRPKFKNGDCSICLDVIKYDKSILPCSIIFILYVFLNGLKKILFVPFVDKNMKLNLHAVDGCGLCDDKSLQSYFKNHKTRKHSNLQKSAKSPQKQQNRL